MSSSELPNPILAHPGAGYSIKVNQPSIYSFDDLTTELIIVPKVPELLANQTTRQIDEKEKNKWILALAAMSYNSIWLSSKIWKRLIERCDWNVNSERNLTTNITEIIPMALFYFLRLLCFLTPDEPELEHKKDLPIEVKNAILFLNRSGLTSVFSCFSISVPFSQFYDSIESFWESHFNGEYC